MKFNENLQKLRKENNLSQEALAEKLGVTRQSVSKWESGASYPEMDKLISMCSIFDCSMDFLLNGKEAEPKEKEETNKEKFNVNNLVNDVVGGVEKTVDMLSKKDGKGILKFILEMVVILFIILLCKIPVEMIKDLMTSVFGNLGTIGDVFATVWVVFIEIAYLILAVLFFVIIFKNRYLDNYDETETVPVKEVNEDNENIEENTIDAPKEAMIKEPKKTKEGGIISFLASILMIFVKFIVACILIGFAFECMFAIIMFAFSIIVFIQGVHMFGPVIGLFGLMLFSILICELLFNFIVNHKTSMKRVFITFLVSFILMGFGISMTTFSFSKMTYIDGVPDENAKIVETKEIDMNNQLLIPGYCHSYSHVEFVVDNNLKGVKLETVSYKGLYHYQVVINNNEIRIENNNDQVNGSELIKEVIENLKNKKIYNYNANDYYDLKVYASEKNIEILKKNINTYCDKVDQTTNDSEYEYYEDQIASLNDANEKLIDENQTLKEEKTELQQKNKELKDNISNALNN